MKRILAGAAFWGVLLLLAPITLARSAPLSAWVKYQAPVLSTGSPGAWDDGSVEAANVYFDANASPKYRMWYTGYGNLEPRPRIGYAASEDGINWSKNSQPVVGYGSGWNGSGSSAPSVLRDDCDPNPNQRWKMWYVGRSSVNFSIGLAYSPDGVNWTQADGNPVFAAAENPDAWDGTSVFAPNVIMTACGSFHMWYGAKGDYLQIGYATSSNGINWTRHPSNPVVRTGVDTQWDNGEITAPSVFRINGNYELWYQGFNSYLERTFIGHAVSPDGVHWQKDLLNPVLGGGPEVWDSYSIYYPAVLNVGGELRMWFHGEASNQSAKQIGMARVDQNHTPTPLPTFPGQATLTNTPIPIDTPTATNTPTSGPSPTPTNTPTPTQTPTARPEDAPTPTTTPTRPPSTYGVIVNDDAPFTRQLSITLDLQTTDSAVIQVKIGNESTLAQAVWQPMAARLPWTLTVDNPVGERTVFVAFGNAEAAIVGHVGQAQDTIFLDMAPPTGQVVIVADGGARTDSQERTLLLNAEDNGSGVDAMRLGSQPTLDPVAWEVYKGLYSWTFDTSDTVYVQYRDLAGNTSPVYSSKLENEVTSWLTFIPLIGRPRGQ